MWCTLNLAQMLKLRELEWSLMMNIRGTGKGTVSSVTGVASKEDPWEKLMNTFRERQQREGKAKEAREVWEAQAKWVKTYI